MGGQRKWAVTSSLALLALALLSPVSPSIARASAAGDAEKGRKIAEQHCSRCHVVGDFNPTGGISSTPSFQMLVKRRPDYRARFSTFFTRRPHPAFISIEGIGRPHEDLPPNAAPIELPPEAIDHIVAFVEELKEKYTKQKQ